MVGGVIPATVISPRGAWPERTPTRSASPWKLHRDLGKRGFTKRIFIVSCSFDARGVRWRSPEECGAIAGPGPQVPARSDDTLAPALGACQRRDVPSEYDDACGGT